MRISNLSTVFTTFSHLSSHPSHVPLLLYKSLTSSLIIIATSIYKYNLHSFSISFLPVSIIWKLLSLFSFWLTAKDWITYQEGLDNLSGSSSLKSTDSPFLRRHQFPIAFHLWARACDLSPI